MFKFKNFLFLFLITVAGSASSSESKDAVSSIVNLINNNNRLLAESESNKKATIPRLYSFGQLHGENEAESFFYKVVESLVETPQHLNKELVVLLEFDKANDSFLQDYLHSSGTKTDIKAFLSHKPWDKSNDSKYFGQASSAMFRLITQLRGLVQKYSRLSVHNFIDESVSKSEQRKNPEYRYSDGISGWAEKYPEATILILSGHLHISRDTKYYKHMISLLRQPTVGINLIHQGGMAYTCHGRVMVCDLNKIGASAKPSLATNVLFAANSDDQDYDYFVNIGKISPSPSAWHTLIEKKAD